MLGLGLGLGLDMCGLVIITAFCTVSPGKLIHIMLRRATTSERSQLASAETPSFRFVATWCTTTSRADGV